MPRKEFPFLMGSDPEFTVLFQNKKIQADRLMKKVCKGVQWGENGMGWRVPEMKGEFGFDGCASTGEIRPDPAKSVDECVENMRSILTNAHKFLSTFSLSTLSTHAPIGGHLHLDIPNNWTENQVKEALRKLLSFYLPITLNENPISRAIRSNGGNYGKIDDFKLMSHRSGNTSIEIRCPSAEWITTPEVMAATLAYVGTVWHELLNNQTNFKKFSKILMRNNQQLKVMQEMAIGNHPLMVEMLFKQIKGAVKTFEFYKEYKKEIDLMLTPKKMIALKTQAQFELFTGWGLNKSTKKIVKKTFLSNKKVNEELKKKNLSQDFTNQITLPHNDDKNVAVFANALEERMLALNWNPKYRFYLFGIKAGIEEPIAGTRDGKIVLGKQFIKNENDRSAIVMTMMRMTERGESVWSKDTIVDPIKGLTFDERPVVAFGIPASWRGDKITKTSKVLELIWNIDKRGKFESTQPVQRKEEDPTSNTAQILNGTESGLELNEIADTGSQGVRLARESIEELRRINGRCLVPQEAPINSLPEPITLTRQQVSAGIFTPETIVNFR